MARTGISYDQVEAAAKAIEAEGGNPSSRIVRDRLKTGSLNTIHKHLSAWRASTPPPSPVAIDIPPDVSKALNGWVTQAATQSRAHTEEKLTQALAEASDLVRAGEELEKERDELQEDLASLATERDKAQATAAANAAEIERLTKDIERERLLAGSAQIETAQAKLKNEEQAGKIIDLTQASALIQTKLDGETQSRIKAERDAAVFEVERDAARAEAASERVRIEGLQMHLDSAHSKTEKMQADYEQKLAAERASVDKEATEAKVAVLEAKALAVENEKLKARLAAAEKEIHSLILSKKVETGKGIG